MTVRVTFYAREAKNRDESWDHANNHHQTDRQACLIRHDRVSGVFCDGLSHTADTRTIRYLLTWSYVKYDPLHHSYCIKYILATTTE